MIRVLVINLERAHERRAHMAAQLAAVGLEAEFLPAVEGRLLPEAEREAAAQAGLTPGELGCYLSHVNAWRVVRERGWPGALILEDDTELDPGLKDVLEALQASDLPFDIVRLSSLKPIRGISVGRLKTGHCFILPTKNPSGAQGYWVSKAGAVRLSEKLASPRLPVDDEFDLYWRHDLYMPVLAPSLVREQSNVVSQIGARGGVLGNEKNLKRHFARVVQAQRRKLAVFRMARRLAKG